MERVYNFSAGPAVIDESVLQQAADELLCYPGKGMSVLEMSHRTPMFMDIYNAAVALFREVMAVPDNYDILFLHGGATMQFSAVPLNPADRQQGGGLVLLLIINGSQYLLE